MPGSIEVVRPKGRTLTGTVRAAGSRAPIEGARVGNPWAGFAVTTDALGRFEIAGWHGQGGRELHAEASGYGRLGRLVPAEGEVDFELTPADEAHGTVVDAAGAPVANALVVAMASRHTNEIQHIDARHTRTADDGAFVVADLRRDLPHTLIVQAPGHGKVFVDFDPHPRRAGRIDLGTIRMTRPLRLEGRVVGRDGAPLAGVPVTLEAVDRALLDAYYTAEERRTDDLGRFRFPDLSEGAYAIVVTRPGRRPLVRETLALDRDRDDVLLRADFGRDIVVRVLDAGGAPVAGMMADAGGTHGKTGADGRVLLEGVADAVRVVKIWPGVPDADAPRGFRPGEAPLRRDGGEVVVRLDETRPVRGRVLGADGAPLSRLFVAAVRPGTRTRIVRAACDDDGRFHLFVRPGEPVDLVVDGTRALSGHRHGIVETIDLFGETAGVRAPADDVTIRAGAMPRDRALTVAVVDPGGEPVAGVEITVSNAGNFPYPDQTARSARSDARGRVRWTDLARRTVRVVVGPADDLDLLVPSAVTAWPDGQTVTLRFERGLAVEGRLVHADGRPAEDATVRVLTMDGQLLGEVATDEDGIFRFRARAGKMHQLFASLPADNGRHYQAWRHNVDPERPIRLELSKVAR